MQDLNDLYYFVQVVDRGGFAAAGRALGMQKSKLSRRIALLEERLGVKLLMRTTRKLTLTFEGQAFLEDCQKLLNDLANAEAKQMLALVRTMVKTRDLHADERIRVQYLLRVCRGARSDALWPLVLLAVSASMAVSTWVGCDLPRVQGGRL